MYACILVVEHNEQSSFLGVKLQLFFWAIALGQLPLHSSLFGVDADGASKLL